MAGSVSAAFRRELIGLEEMVVVLRVRIIFARLGKGAEFFGDGAGQGGTVIEVAS